MRIAFITPAFLPTMGGAESVIHKLAGHVASSENEAVVFTNRKAGVLRNLGYPVRSYAFMTYYLANRWPVIGRRYLSKQLMDFHRREQANLWHTHFAGPFSICAVETAAELGIPVILTCHGQRDVDHLRRIQDNAGRNPLKNDVVKYVTAGSTDMCLAIEQTGVPESKVKRVPWGVDNNLFSSPPKKSSSRETLRISADRFVWITVARNATVKNLGAILTAIRKLVDSGETNVHWLAVGTGVLRLRKQITSMGLSDHVLLYEPKDSRECYDELPSPEVVGLLQCANGYISLSKSESFGIAVLEAMAAGLPVVASDISGHRDIIESDSDGMLVDHNNVREVTSAVKRVMNNATFRNSLGEQAMATARKFDWATTFTAFDVLYNSASRGNSP